MRGDKLVDALDKAGIAASAGAACGSSTWEPSHVLLAMGLSMPEAVGGLRLSLSAENTGRARRLLRALPGAVAACDRACRRERKLASTDATPLIPCSLFLVLGFPYDSCV